jgi:hypothetical protein
MIFKNPVYYHLTNDQEKADAKSDFKKIIDYLLSFAGDISISNQKDGAAVVSYSETPMRASLKTTGKLNRQITLTCEKEDNVSVGLIKNVTRDINYRIFNTQTLSYLVNDPGILDLTTANVDVKILKIIKGHGLTPLFQYRDSLVFYAKDKLGKIHLVNRHLLEYLIKAPLKKLYKSAFSIIVAKDIGRFVALFDRGLIPISFYKGADNDVKVINLSDFDIQKLQRNIFVERINFLFDQEKQSFAQNSSELIEVKKGKGLTRSLKLKKYLAIKIAQDIGYSLRGNILVPKLKVSVFLDK